MAAFSYYLQVYGNSASIGFLYGAFPTNYGAYNIQAPYSFPGGTEYHYGTPASLEMNVYEEGKLPTPEYFYGYCNYSGL